MGKNDRPPQCQTCGGSGTIAHVHVDDKGRRTTTQVTCHHCGGSGTR
jgi:DnaJ-class molecular chaperone